MNQGDFFNTIALEGAELKKAKEQTGLQDRRVLGLFEFYGVKFTPFKIHELYENHYGLTPVTSIRRSITSLTDAGKLVKTKEFKMERYGKRNHYWEIVKTTKP